MNWTDELARLHALHQRAALTDDEYRLAKRRLLSDPPAVEGLRSGINGLRRARGGARGARDGTNPREAW